MVEVAVLGSVGVRRNGSESATLARSARQLLAIVVAAGPEGLSVERCADELWPSKLPATWESSLRMAFTRLRRQLPPDTLITTNGWCRLELPPTNVDLWHLTDLAAEAPDLLNGDVVIDLTAREAFPSVEVSPLIRSAADQFDVVRIAALDRLIDEHVDISPVAVAKLNAFVTDREWDALLASRAEQLSSRLSSPPHGSWPDRSISTALPRSLARSLPPRLVGRDGLVNQLTALVLDHEQPITTLAAGSRTGRTSVLAGVGARLVELGWRVVHLEPMQPPAAFAPFLQALPQLRSPIIEALDSRGDPTHVRSRCWTAILSAIDDPMLPTCVIVDDAELLDGSSEGALGFIARSSTTQPMALLVGVDPAHPAAAESAWMRAPVHAIEPLEASTVADWVGELHPTIVDDERERLGREISELSDGRGADAHHLLMALDADTFALPSSGIERASSRTSLLDDETKQVAAAATILGSTVSLSALEHVTDRPPHLVLTAVDTLLGIDALVETSRPDEFTVTSLLHRREPEPLVKDGELRLLHLRAMSLPSIDPPAIAAHALAARPDLSDAEAAAAQATSAAWLHRHSRHREAVAHFASAEELGASLTADQLSTYANALEIVGSDALAVRERAVNLATRDGEHAIALQIAIDGLPATEALEGNQARVRLVRSIDPSTLTRADQVQRHLMLSRQLLLVSDIEEASREAERGSELAETLIEQADAWLAKAHLTGWMPEGDARRGFRPLRFPSLNDIDDPVRIARLHQATAVSSLIAGDFVTAGEAAERSTTAAQYSGDPVRIWHAGVIRSTLALNELQLAEATRIADQTRDHGVAHALNAPVATRLAQASNQAVLLGGGAEVLDRVAAAIPEARQSLLAQAGTAHLLAVSGRQDEALSIAERVIDAAVGSRFESAILGVLSHVDLRASEARARLIFERLDERRGQAMIVGAGVSSAGPVEGLLANVAPSHDEELALGHQALTIVDGWQSPLWQIVCRVRLAARLQRSGRTDEAGRCLDEARSRAEGTELAGRERWGLFTHS